MWFGGWLEFVASVCTAKVLSACAEWFVWLSGVRSVGDTTVLEGEDARTLGLMEFMKAYALWRSCFLCGIMCLAFRGE